MTTEPVSYTHLDVYKRQEVALQLEELKNSRKVKKIGILGCLLNRYGDDLKKEFPTVDIWARAEEWEKVLAYLGKNEICFDSRARGFIPETVKWSRYLKIVEGCNNRCSYCCLLYTSRCV